MVFFVSLVIKRYQTIMEKGTVLFSISPWVLSLFSFFGLFGPSKIGSPWSSFHTPQGAAHFTPYAFATGQAPYAFATGQAPYTALRGRRDKFLWSFVFLIKMKNEKQN
jgi:hypothetical protein